LGAVDFLVGTFSKSLGGIGGFAVSRYEELSLLHFVARAYIYTASGSPANLAGVRAALSIMLREPERRERLFAVIRRMRAGLATLGYSIGEVESPIVPIYIGRPETTLALWRALLAEGLYVNIVLPPGCPAERCLLRTSCTAVTTDEHLHEALGIYERVGRRLGVIQKGI
jgi:8-amino-7-oxononanoate synthase